jgi:hypothetical protein
LLLLAWLSSCSPLDSKSPAYDLKLAWDTWSFLPWALLIHLVGSVFMFGNPSLVPPVTYAKKVTTDETWAIGFVSSAAAAAITRCSANCKLCA